jgi:aminomethyltransferase
MVPFAGWSMPIQYKDTIMESTIHCRTHASIFDVSHMCGLTLSGKDAITFLETLVVADVASLQDGTGTLSVFTNEKGGIIDDTVITRVTKDEIYLVVNAGCREKDLAHLEAQLKKFSGDVKMTVHDDRALLALQGPEAAAVLQPYVEEDLSKVYFSNFRKLNIDGVPCFLTRTGYTGEDGFELSIPNSNVLAIAKKLVADDRVRMCGLGPRDSLRLEAGLCLYGNDLTEDITPIEAGLTWTIAKSRREACAFLGGDVIKKQLADGVSVRRVGFIAGGAPPRQGSPVLTADGKKVGEISSGGFSPCLKKNIAMGYVDKAFAKAGTELKVEVRGKQSEAVVTKMPFVETHYYK